MSARSHHRIRQSTAGLDDAGMDLQAAQLSTRTGQDIHSVTALSWLDWQLPLFIVLCAIAGAILFTFLILLWLRRQMSHEKDSEDGDRRGLVEEGIVGCSDKAGKSTKSSVEAQWVHRTAEKPSASTKTSSTLTERPPSASTEKSLVSVDKSIPMIKLSSSTDKPILTEKVTVSQKLSKSIETIQSLQSQASALPGVITVATPERRPEPIRIKAKGLLERRGSSASLTIELAPAPESPPHMVTPTRECTAEEFLLSAGNILSRAQLRKVIGDPASLHKEFWEVPLNLPEKVDICGSGVKNRYCTVLPNPQSRVVLPSTSDDPLSSYINANYIRGYDGEDARYIATQGPLAHTIEDFWKMVWAERVPAVVMMTRLHEATKTKCDAYFPLDVNSRIQAGSFTIMVNSIDTRDGYTVRDLELRHERERRHVQHYWYDSWPDHAVPQAADALVNLASKVNSLPGPVVVHCSAGIGRTGCFIAVATGMTQLLRDGNVDVLGILCQMRYDRGGMVQTAEQYEFVHRALCLFEQTLDGKSTSLED